MRSILAKASVADIITDPFPYVVVRNALDDDIYEQLAAEYPSFELVTGGQAVGSNQRLLYFASDARTDERISPLWRQFLADQVSPEFYQEVIALFGEQIRALYPWLEVTLGKKLEDLTAGIQWKNENADIDLNADISWNTPVTYPSQVRSGHVDNPLALYGGLLYFRMDNDNVAGGDLEIYRAKRSQPPFYAKAEMETRYLEQIQTVAYEKNTLVFFINSVRSFHGVTARSVTDLERRFFNVIGRFRFPLFELPRGGLVYRARQMIARRLGLGPPLPRSLTYDD